MGDGPACENCHTVNGFTPAGFTIDRHNQSRFKLENAHLAIPCIFCHKEQHIQNTKTRQFQFTAVNCEACHKNTHDQSLQFLSGRAGISDRCAFCHETSAWKQVRFDHSQTGFALLENHAVTGCRQCHTRNAQVVFDQNRQECAACHDDVHRGQLRAESQSQTDCSGCHSPKDWFAEKFNHETQTSFSLKGGHQSVPCAKCHPAEQDEKGSFTRYKPLSAECKTCHGLNGK